MRAEGDDRAGRSVSSLVSFPPSSAGAVSDSSLSSSAVPSFVVFILLFSCSPVR